MMSPPSSPTPNPIDRLMNSQFTRLLVIGFLVLILQIPTVMLFGIISERQNLRQTAIQDVTSKWGKEQTLVGPRLMVPYIKRSGTAEKPKSEQKIATFLPKDLEINGNMETDTRKRGLLQVPVYTLKLEMKGNFEPLDSTAWAVKQEDILWNRSELVVQISDTRAISDQVNLQWNKTKIPFNPGLGKFKAGNPSLPINSLPPGTSSGFDSRSTAPASTSSAAGIHARLSQMGEKSPMIFRFRWKFEAVKVYILCPWVS